MFDGFSTPHRTRGAIARSVAIAIAALAVPASGSLADPPESAGDLRMPDLWRGVWRIDLDASNDALDRSIMRIFTPDIAAADLLVGLAGPSELVGPFEPSRPPIVRGRWDAARAVVTFHADGSLEGGCDVTLVVSLVADRSSDALTGQLVVTRLVSESLARGCTSANTQRYRLDGERVDPFPFDVTQPREVLPVWAGLWDITNTTSNACTERLPAAPRGISEVRLCEGEDIADAFFGDSQSLLAEVYAGVSAEEIFLAFSQDLSSGTGLTVIGRFERLAEGSGRLEQMIWTIEDDVTTSCQFGTGDFVRRDPDCAAALLAGTGDSPGGAR